MRTLRPLERKLVEAWPPGAWSDVSVLLAVSGGADSVAMLQAMTRVKERGPGRLVVGHLNHGLRDAASDQDQSLVESVCHSLNLDFETTRLPSGALEAADQDGLEAAARHARYAFLQSTAERVGARYVVTAHSADDQAETILHRILRGTGLGGLAGIPRTRRLSAAATLVRPLLAVRRRELVEYLEDLDQPYRDDPTNADIRFTRNRIRHELLPQLEDQYNPKVIDAICRLGHLAGEANQVIDSLAGELQDRSARVSTRGTVTLSGGSLTGEPRYLIREMIIRVWRNQQWPEQEMGFAEWDSLATMLTGENVNSESRTMPGNVLVKREEHPRMLKLSRQT